MAAGRDVSCTHELCACSVCAQVVNLETGILYYAHGSASEQQQAEMLQGKGSAGAELQSEGVAFPRAQRWEAGWGQPGAAEDARRMRLLRLQQDMLVRDATMLAPQSCTTLAGGPSR